MLDLKIEHGTLVIPGVGLVRSGLGIKDGKIVIIGSESALPEARRVVDASQKHILPGVVDPHVHLGMYRDLKDECITESREALVGGITTVGCHVDVGLGPAEGVFEDMVQQFIRHLYTDVFCHLIVSSEAQLDMIPVFASRFGVTSFKFYTCSPHGRPLAVSDDILWEAFRRIADLDMPALAYVHAQNESIVRGAADRFFHRKQGATLVDWAETHPSVAEEEAIVRVAYLAGQVGARLYLAHVASEPAAKRVRRVKREFKEVYAEALSPHLSLTKYHEKGLVARMVPPLRGEEDVEELWRTVADDTIDAFGTDHSGRPKPLLGTHLPVLLTEGHQKRGLDLCQLVDKMTRRPAEIFGIYPRKGAISPGSDADLVLVDLTSEIEVSRRNLHSAAGFSLQDGQRLIGWPVMTIKSGVIAVENGVLKVEPGDASYLSRS